MTNNIDNKVKLLNRYTKDLNMYRKNEYLKNRPRIILNNSKFSFKYIEKKIKECNLRIRKLIKLMKNDEGIILERLETEIDRLCFFLNCKDNLSIKFTKKNINKEDVILNKYNNKVAVVIRCNNLTVSVRYDDGKVERVYYADIKEVYKNK